MNTQLTERNTQIIAAYTAGNINKTELARYFGVSASTVRRVLAGVVIISAGAVTPGAEAALTGNDLAIANQYISDHQNYPEYIKQDILTSNSLQQVHDVLLRNTYWNGSATVPVEEIPMQLKNVVAPVVTPPVTQPLAPVKLDVVPAVTLNVAQQTPVAPAQTQQLTPTLITPSAPQKTPVAPVQTTQLTPQATPQIAPQKTPVAPVQTAQLTPQATPQIAPQKTPVALVQTAQLTPQATPQIAPQKKPVALVQTAQLTPQATPQIAPQKTPVALVKTAQLTPQATPQVEQKTPALPTPHLDGQHIEVAPKPEADKVPAKLLTASGGQTVQQLTSTAAQQPVVKQVVRSAYYDQQITALNAEAEQNHVEILAESHSRAVADAQTLGQANDYTNKKFNDLKSEVDGNKKEAAAGSASAMAQANIPQVQESQQFAVGAGVGGYDSQNALSVGASFHASRSTIVKMSVSDDTQSNFGYGAGVSVGW